MSIDFLTNLIISFFSFFVEIARDNASWVRKVAEKGGKVLVKLIIPRSRSLLEGLFNPSGIALQTFQEHVSTKLPSFHLPPLLSMAYKGVIIW